MRGFKIAVPVVLVALMAATSFAAGAKMSKMSSGSTTHDWTFGITGGASLPTGDYSDKNVLGANTGWNFGGQGDYWMNSMWGFGVDASFHSNKAKDDFNAALVPTFGANSEAKYTAIQYGVHATYLIPMQGQVAPYLQGGVSGYNVKQKIDGGTTTSDESVNKAGFNVGAGVDFHATPVVNLGIGGVYHYVTKDSKIGDKALNFLGIEGRVSFKIPTNK